MAVGGPPAGSGSFNSKYQIRQILVRKINSEGGASSLERLSRGMASEGNTRPRGKCCLLRVSVREDVLYKRSREVICRIHWPGTEFVFELADFGSSAPKTKVRNVSIL